MGSKDTGVGTEKVVGLCLFQQWCLWIRHQGCDRVEEALLDPLSLADYRGTRLGLPIFRFLKRSSLVTKRTSRILLLRSPVSLAIFSILIPLINSRMIPQHSSNVTSYFRLTAPSFILRILLALRCSLSATLGMGFMAGPPFFPQRRSWLEKMDESQSPERQMFKRKL